ncbi:hypothetical protein ABID16_001676 [Rhizobium aquaticum]|uniref:Uncharacterized protein n=1 Tax=Rhizobium aquaticum TaxID=1549636 RepID=A0ABV2IY00_9HYPH
MTIMGEGTSSQETPEGLFLVWLFAQPQGADIATAARLEITRMGRMEIATETRARLIGMLIQAAVTPQCVNRKTRRQRH